MISAAIIILLHVFWLAYTPFLLDLYIKVELLFHRLIFISLSRYYKTVS